jgi:phytanoyl-CoA hydroxylase
MGSLTREQIAQFEEEGYLLVRGLFNPEEDLDPIIEEYKGVLDGLASELYAKGEISSTHDDLPFSERLIRVYQESGKVHAQYFDFSLPQANVQPDTPFWAGPAVFSALRNERLLDAVESLIGPEIYSNPVQHVRMKPPERLTPKNEQGRVQLGKTPVHQDNGVVTPDADETQMLTVWFPLTRATVKHGCLTVWPGSHRKGLLDHCPTDIGLGIPGKLMGGSKAIPMPMERGDALFMHRLTAHASFSNTSDEVRWSFDLRYNPIGQPTGRSHFPGFVARSRQHPELELRDPTGWESLWRETRDHLATIEMGKFNRWNSENPVCA